jgi:hypothetical protein
MRIYIENIRDEIFAQYEKCFYGREQMESFLPLYSSMLMPIRNLNDRIFCLFR